MTLYEKLRKAEHRDTFRVRTIEDNPYYFTIEVKRLWGVSLRGYGVIPEGRKRVGKRGHLLMSEYMLRDWTTRLEEVAA